MTTLELRHISKKRGRRWVLHNVSFTFTAPGVFLVQGDNGIGKSTLLDVLSGVRPFDTGEVRVAGHDLKREPQLYKQCIGYAADSVTPFPELSLDELARLIAAIRRCPLPGADAVKRFGLGELRARPLASLSLGQRRRALLLLATLGQPSFLLLDEPTNGLDAGGQSLFLELLAEQRTAGRAVIIATHDASLVAPAADQRVRMSEGGRLTREG